MSWNLSDGHFCCMFSCPLLVRGAAETCWLVVRTGVRCATGVVQGEGATTRLACACHLLSVVAPLQLDSSVCVLKY